MNKERHATYTPHVKLHDGYDGFAFYMEPKQFAEYGADVCLSNAKINFLKIPDVEPLDVTLSLLKERLDDADYVKNNNLTISRDTALLSFEPVPPLRK